MSQTVPLARPFDASDTDSWAGVPARVRATAILLACVLIAYLGVALAGSGGAGWGRAIYVAGNLLAVSLLAARVAASPGGSGRAGWALVALGLGLWSMGDVVYVALSDDGQALPTPSLADLLYLAGYPLCGAGAWVIARANRPGRPVVRQRGEGRTRRALEAAASGTAAAALAAAIVSGPVIDGVQGQDVLATVTIASYPVLDAAVLAVLAVLAARGRQFTRSDRLATLGVLAFIVTDALYARQSALGVFEIGIWWSVGWPLGIAFVAWAAWSPVHAEERRQPRWSGLPVALATGTVLLIAVDHALLFEVGDVCEGLSYLTVLFALASLRAAERDISNARDRASEESVTDHLTGLPNRRALMHDLDAAHHDGTPVRLALFDLNGFKDYNDSFGHPAGDELLARLGHRLAVVADAADARAYRMGGDEFCVLVDTTDTAASAVTVIGRCGSALAEHSQAFAIDASWGEAAMPADTREPAGLLQLADDAMYARKGRARMGSVAQSRTLLQAVMKQCDGPLAGHSGHVADLAWRTARLLGMPDDQAELVRLAADLHDVGKLAIPDHVLHKPAALDDDELRFMRQHTIIGARICASVPALAQVAPIVRASHERWDGAGYPDGLVGENIPPAARIVFCADAFDAMTSNRPYRKAMTAAAALDELRAHRGDQFQPEVVDALAAAWQEQQVADAELAPAGNAIA